MRARGRHVVVGSNNREGRALAAERMQQLGRRHLDFAADLAGDMARDCPELFAPLTQRIGLTEQEIEQWWAAAAAHLQQ